ncbi:hypothetical protein J5Y04_30890 [Kitasatospora sp. RG8]|uniref:hypothetical protein n=1 Tax=Kitasatospora sp. RG8 TaxID=2820815 RepID=UPI001AE02A63|nr:hypothetical protein [Kitasatospora sp. RG8]MBP0453915.1 hypothetical protein [Kitasatospora sp. RG8]
MTAPLSSPDNDPVEPHAAEPHAAGPHPSVDELADLAEGLVGSADDAEALRSHLAGCAECRETAEALAEVQALLGSAEPPAMPADVAARLDAALTAAADERDTPAEGPGAPRQASAPAGPAGAPARPSGPAPAPSPAPLGPPGRPATSAAGTGPGRSRSRRRRTALLLGTAAALLAAGLGGSLLFSPADRKASDTTAVSAAAPTAGAMPSGTPKSARAEHANGGTVYRDDQLAAQVQQLLARAGVTPDGSAQASGQASGPSTGKSEAPPTDAQQGIAGGPGAAACPAPADGPLLATDTGSYSGAPAEVLVYAVPDQPQKLDVYLRSPGCGPVLLHRTVPAR